MGTQSDIDAFGSQPIRSIHSPACVFLCVDRNTAVLYCRNLGLSYQWTKSSVLGWRVETAAWLSVVRLGCSSSPSSSPCGKGICENSWSTSERSQSGLKRDDASSCKSTASISTSRLFLRTVYKRTVLVTGLRTRFLCRSSNRFAYPVSVVQTGYTTPTQRFSAYTKPLRGCGITYIYFIRIVFSAYDWFSRTRRWLRRLEASLRLHKKQYHTVIFPHFPLLHTH